MRLGLISSLFFTLLFSAVSTHAQQSSCTVPLTETKSAPAIDLIFQGAPIDRDTLVDRIKVNEDISTLEPQISDIYSGIAQTLNEPVRGLIYPEPNDTVTFAQPLSGTSGLVRARVNLTRSPSIAYQLNFSLDTHAALARNALLRKLGYTIPSPKYYRQIKVIFKNLDSRNLFLDHLADNTLTSRARWVVGGLEAIDKNELTVIFQDVVIEPALIEVPQLHWGILTEATINSRRSIRALLAPLTLLDVPESVNMYSFEPAKIFNEGLVFTRPNADKFKNETALSDLRWIANKIAKLTRQDWNSIIQAGQYPPDIQALIVEKTLGRVNQLMTLLEIKNFTPHKYDPYITYGNVINGKALKEAYDGYALRFTYGDPKSPLRSSELVRFFAIEGIGAGMSVLLGKINGYLQLLTPDRYVTKHQQKFYDDVLNHIQNHPNEPYVQPLEVWGGPIAGAAISASRNIVTGTYYGSTSEVQLVDQVSASVSAGAFIGVSGLPKIGLGVTPQLSYNRSYVHVRPLSDIKTAWKDNWKNVYVPHFMKNLSGVLSGKADQTSADAMKSFLAEMKTGEMFIVTDGLSTGTSTMVGIPLGAVLGVLPSVANITETVTFGHQYAILSRTTLFKSKDGLHIYLSRIRANTFELTLDTEFFIKVLSVSNAQTNGEAHTKAFIFPEKFDDETKERAFQRAVGAILRRNNPDILEEEFYPFLLDHAAHGHRTRIKVGPWSWSNRENFHRMIILPPYDPEGRYTQSESTRSIIDGQLIKINGTDLYGFFGSLVKKVLPFINIGGAARGDDPSSNFMGRSKTFAVSTEVETTPSRDNRTFSRIQQTYSGWSMNKRRLLKIVDELSEQLREYSPNGGLINKDEFAQTRKVQAYTVLWSLLVYEKGIHRMLGLLNVDELSTKQAQNRMIAIMGQDEYKTFCEQSQLPIGFYSGPHAMGADDSGSAVESSKGQMTLVGCVTPWMKTIYSLRQSMKRAPEAFLPEVRGDDEAEEKVRWINRSFAKLAKNMDIALLLRMVGKDQSFFQVRVSGFRTKDENGDSEYFSNTVGSINSDVLTGPLSDINEASNIQVNELQARYLSDGY